MIVLSVINLNFGYFKSLLALTSYLSIFLITAINNPSANIRNIFMGFFYFEWFKYIIEDFLYILRIVKHDKFKIL